MKIATWNVNSIRTRLDQVLDWLQRSEVDVLCLQETKVVDADFPRSRFEELNYHLIVSGQKAYNGVAIVSRQPLESVSRGFAPIVGDAIADDLDDQKRVITGIIDGIRIVNLYVPNGSAIGSDKYQYKLRWLAVLRQYLQTLLETDESQNTEKASPEILVCGDFNIALEDIDIYKAEGRETHIMASDVERQTLYEILELGFADVFRKFTTESGHFSWWDYRAGSFRRNHGWRIDHHYLTPTLYEHAKDCYIDAAPRKLTKPSERDYEE